MWIRALFLLDPCVYIRPTHSGARALVSVAGFVCTLRARSMAKVSVRQLLRLAASDAAHDAVGMCTACCVVHFLLHAQSLAYPLTAAWLIRQSSVASEVHLQSRVRN